MSFDPTQSKSNSFKRMNPHLFRPHTYHEQIQAQFQADKPPKRIRQSQKPRMSPLEQEWFDHLCAMANVWETRGVSGFQKMLRGQAKRYEYGNGAWYKSDITASRWPHTDIPFGPIETAWEVKGPKQMKGIARGMVVLKAAAHCWPEIRFILVWKDDQGNWQEQVILP